MNFIDLQIKLTHGPPLTIKVTHPRVLYHLAYLVSAVSKRDAVGRRPKRKVFAVEGLGVLEKESRKEIHRASSFTHFKINLPI